MTSLAQIKDWSERFPFDEGELEIILRCYYASVNSDKGGDSFLNILAHSFPYVFFFLPQDELEIRTAMIEKYILPQEFGERLKKAIFQVSDSDNEERAIESLIEGVANSCRREPKDALAVLFDCCSTDEGTADPGALVYLCYSLSIAADLLVSKHADEKRIKSFAKDAPRLDGLKTSLSEIATDNEGGLLTKINFIDWGTTTVPFIHSCLRTFIHNLIFHGKSTKSKEQTYVHPELLDSSDIFTYANASLLFTIVCMAPNMGGKWRRLFTTKMEETPANCLQGAVSYHVGPSVFVIETTSGAVIGGCVESMWKVCYFLFQLEPSASIYQSARFKSNGNFFINHNEKYVSESGEVGGFGFYEDDDSTKWNTSHVFFSRSLDVCIASFFDVNPASIKVFEIWGFGDDLYD